MYGVAFLCMGLLYRDGYLGMPNAGRAKWKLASAIYLLILP